MREHHKRSVVKAICWRALATLTTTIIVFVFTRKLALAIEVGAVEVTAKLLLYYFHERIWGFIGWGKPNHPLEGLRVTRDLEPEHLDEIKGRLEELGYL
jgi:adenylylsulfate kinase